MAPLSDWTEIPGDVQNIMIFDYQFFVRPDALTGRLVSLSEAHKFLCFHLC